MKRLPTIKLAVFLCLFLLTPLRSYVHAAFSGGINVGDHHNEMSLVGNLVGSWLYVLMRPTDGTALNTFLADSRYSDVSVIVRGHFPDVPLTAEYAVSWANTLEGISRPIYFVPVNEPNNPSESSGGITATNVKNYVSVLRGELAERGLLGSKVKLLSPAMDVYQLADSEDGYVQELGGWSFFSQFDGVALNLYGQYRSGVLDTSAPAIKRGTGYREMFRVWGASESQAQSVKVFAVESGVMRVEDGRVKYRENTALIKNYFDTLKLTWLGDPNFVMFAVFSYDPGGDKTPWIYTASVLQSMNIGAGSVDLGSDDGTLQTTSGDGSTTGAGDSPGEETYIDEQTITKNANERLLPRTIISKRDKEQEGCANGFSLFGITCVPWFGAGLAHETQYFQPGFVTRDKVINEEDVCNGLECLFDSIGNLFSQVIHPQTAKVETGALNAFRPRSLMFSQGKSGLNPQQLPGQQQADAGGTIEGGRVLAEETGDLKVDVKDAYLFTMRMLLPRSLAGKLALNTSGTSGAAGQPDLDGTLQNTSNTTTTSPLPSGSNSASFTSIRQLADRAASWAGMPWQIVEAMLVIEGSGYQKGMSLDTLNIGVFGLTPQEIQDFSKPNAKADIYCSVNSCSAAGVMQMTTVGCYPFDTCQTKKDDTNNAICSSCGGACTYKPSAWSYYKDAVLEAENDGRTPNICNIKDSIYAGAKKMKTDSKTPFGVLSDWDRETVRKVAEAYYGSCTPCDRATGGGKYACDRLGMTYCDFVWDYYQARKNFTVAQVTPSPSASGGQVVGNPVYYSQKDLQFNDELSSDYSSCADPNDPVGRSRLDKAGCGQTTMAMILATYMDRTITPVDVVKTYYRGLSCDGTTPSQAIAILENSTNGKFRTTPVFDQVAVDEEYYTYEEAVDMFREFFDTGWQIWGNAEINGRGHHFWVVGIDSEDRLLVMDPTYGIGQPYPMVQSKVGSEKGVPILYKRAFAFKRKVSVGSPL